MGHFGPNGGFDKLTEMAHYQVMSRLRASAQ